MSYMFTAIKGGPESVHLGKPVFSFTVEQLAICLHSEAMIEEELCDMCRTLWHSTSLGFLAGGMHLPNWPVTILVGKILSLFFSSSCCFWLFFWLNELTILKPLCSTITKNLSFNHRVKKKKKT